MKGDHLGQQQHSIVIHITQYQEVVQEHVWMKKNGVHEVQHVVLIKTAH